MAETTHPRRPAAARIALVAVAATFLLGACAQAGPSDAPDAGTAPTGSSSPSVPVGDGADDGAAEGGPSVAWLEEGTSFSLTLFGSSTCPPAVESVEAAGADAVTVRLAPADPGMCTMDYVPSVTEHELPDGVDGRPVTVDVVPAEEGAEPVSLELP